MSTTGFATIGTSKITKRFLNALKECEDFKLVAVYSRDIKKAETFAEEQGAERFYDSAELHFRRMKNSDEHKKILERVGMIRSRILCIEQVPVAHSLIEYVCNSKIS